MDEQNHILEPKENPYLLPEKVYQVLKWVALVCIPAVAAFYGMVGAAWAWPYIQEILTTAAGLEFLIGALIGVSTIKGGISNG